MKIQQQQENLNYISRCSQVSPKPLNTVFPSLHQVATMLGSRSCLKRLIATRGTIRLASSISSFQANGIFQKSLAEETRKVFQQQVKRGLPLAIPSNISLVDTVIAKGNNEGKKEESEGIPKEKSEDKIKEEENEKEKEKPVIPSKPPRSAKKASSSSASTPSSPGEESGSGSGSGNGNGSGSSGSDEPNVTELPEVYPQIMALPISRRPLYPGFYKAVIITDPTVMKAIKEMLDRKQPYIGCFLFKDENKDSDVIRSKDEVYETGVLAQITSNVYTKDNHTGVETLTTVLFPHKRIKIDEMFLPNENQKEEKHIIEGITGEKEGDLMVATREDFENPVEPVVKAEPVEKAEDENPTEFLRKYPITLVNVSNLEDKPYEKDSPMVNSLTAAILQVFKDIAAKDKMFSEHLISFTSSLKKDVFQVPEKLADYAASITAGNDKELQEILECTNIEKRLEMALTVLKKELMNKELQSKIEKDLEERMAKRHREYHLNEQLKWIKKELGIDDGRDKLIAKYNERVKDLKMPEEIKKVFDEEMNKLSTLEPLMSEFTVTRNYLDWLTQVPWGKESVDELSIKRAVTILDEDHYGLKDVKDRILEFIAVGKLLNKVNGKIVCFVGPPGVGKTSIGKSIARALNREFYRFSVGGLTDVSEIKGHRRTYVGAIPGRAVQALKKTQTENPLILIDEIDKISHTHSVNGGDPSSALLELLDPEQNSSFMDNYMDVPIDMSKVLFVCTANTLSTIPGPLLDRMEVIDIAGYIEDEKMKIAERYLAPTAKKTCGLDKVDVTIEPEAISSLIKHYCRESGVRNLKKHIDKIYRKAAFNVVKEVGDEDSKDIEAAAQQVEEKEEKIADETIGKKNESEPKSEEKSDTSEQTATESEASVSEIPVSEIPVPEVSVPEGYQVSITADNLKEYVGPQVYISDRLYETTVPGVVMGLAWTSMGGSALYIESVLEQAITEDSSAHLEITGQLGDVMKESSKIAYSFSRMFMTRKYPENRFFEKANIHLHCPEGATPKDGPSAGVTMTSSLLSLALNKPLSPTVAMTGELTLTGKVLRIGGLKEKAIAAKRSGVKTIIFPIDNLSDWKELPDNIKEGLEPVAASWYDEVFARVFPDVDPREASLVWKAEFDKIEQNKKKKEA